MNPFMTSCKQLLTDNNYQSYQSFFHEISFYWVKIGKIGNYCQFSTKGADS